MDDKDEALPRRNDDHSEKAQPRFVLVIHKYLDKGIEIVDVRCENHDIPLPEIILVVENFLEKLKAHYKGTLPEIRFKT